MKDTVNEVRRGGKNYRTGWRGGRVPEAPTRETGSGGASDESSAAVKSKRVRKAVQSACCIEMVSLNS